MVPGMANALKRLRTERGWTHDQIADRMGLSRGGYLKLERGERKLNEHTINLAAKAFGVPRSIIMGDEISLPPPSSAPELPVYTAVEAGAGTMVISTDPIDTVPRPWYVKNIRDAYAVLVVGDSMHPVLEAGDLAIVNPRLPPMRQKDMVFVSGEKLGEFTATIKRLIRWTDREWIVCQFNPPPGQKHEFVLSRAQWPKALRVVGKYYGG